VPYHFRSVDDGRLGLCLDIVQAISVCIGAVFPWWSIGLWLTV
jgi:hypothetical protein